MEDINNIDDKRLDDVLKNLLHDAELSRKLKIAITDFFTIVFCVFLLEKTKHNKELHKAAQIKVLKTLEGLSIFKQYIAEKLN